MTVQQERIFGLGAMTLIIAGAFIAGNAGMFAGIGLALIALAIMQSKEQGKCRYRANGQSPRTGTSIARPSRRPPTR